MKAFFINILNSVRSYECSFLSFINTIHCGVYFWALCMYSIDLFYHSLSKFMPKLCTFYKKCSKLHHIDVYTTMFASHRL